MTRHIIIALAVVIAVFGVGLLLRNALFAERVSQPPAPSAAPPVSARPAQLTVRRVEGRVERRDANGQTWLPLPPNASVSARDSVRTDEGARAVLADAQGLELELFERSELALSLLKPDEAKVVVERGRLGAALGRSTGTLRVGSRGSDAWVEATQGAFSVLRDGRGKLAVAVTDGDVAVTAHRTRVQVSAGEQSVVSMNEAPAPPSHIPPSLFLKVSRSGPSRVKQRSTQLAGRTTPGSAVYVNGMPVDTDDAGHFVAKVPLKEGRNKLHVTVRDVLGRHEQAELPDVTVDTEPPKLKGKTVW